MKCELYGLSMDMINSIMSYLVRNSKDKKDIAFMGTHDSFGPNPGNSYFLHNEFGIRINGHNLIIYGKNKKVIGEEFSKLEELSKEY